MHENWWENLIRPCTWLDLALSSIEQRMSSVTCPPLSDTILPAKSGRIVVLFFYPSGRSQMIGWKWSVSPRFHHRWERDWVRLGSAQWAETKSPFTPELIVKRKLNLEVLSKDIFKSSILLWFGNILYCQLTFPNCLQAYITAVRGSVRQISLHLLSR